MIKWIISDVDGTLLAHDRTLPKRNFEAIETAKKQGIQFGIATGRDASGITFISEHYGIDISLGIVGNGAQVIDKMGQLLAECYLDNKAFLQVATILEQRQLPYMVYTTTGVYALDIEWVRDSFIARSMAKHGTKREDYNAGGSLSHVACMRLKPIENMVTFAQTEHIIKVESFSLDVPYIQDTKEMLSQISGISCLSSFADNIEITDMMAQKGLVLESVLPKLNVTKDEVIVIGDALNDTTLFERFPFSFAPSNAVDSIKSKAFKVVSSNSQGAVADAIAWALQQP